MTISLIMAIPFLNETFHLQHQLHGVHTVIEDLNELLLLLLNTHLAIPRRIIPAEPTSKPAFIMPHGSAKLPDPILAFAKLKKVAILLK